MFYRLDSTRVTLREHSWGASWILWPIVLPIAAFLKLFRVRIPSSTDDPPVEELRPFEVDASAIPKSIRENMRPLERQLELLGFERLSEKPFLSEPQGASRGF